MAMTRRSLRVALRLSLHPPPYSSSRPASSSALLPPASPQMLSTRRSRRHSQKALSSRRKLDFDHHPCDQRYAPLYSCLQETADGLRQVANQEVKPKKRGPRKSSLSFSIDDNPPVFASGTPGHSSLTANEDCADVLEAYKRRRLSGPGVNGKGKACENGPRVAENGAGFKDEVDSKSVEERISERSCNDVDDPANGKQGHTFRNVKPRNPRFRKGKSGKEGYRMAVQTADTDSVSVECKPCLALVPAEIIGSEVAFLSQGLGSIDIPILYEGPFPAFSSPSAAECLEVKERLEKLHGPLEEYAKHRITNASQAMALEGQKQELDEALHVVVASTTQNAIETGYPRERRTVLDSLVATILSQNTSDRNSRRAFASLKDHFPTWEKVYAADPKHVEDAIRCGGLAEIKATRIVNILNTLHSERGELCLEYVRDMANDEIKLELSRFKGVGPKTIACVLMFHLQQDEFPVDTHVFRIAKMLGWVPLTADREKAYLHLNHRIPNELKFDLHCLLVTHGKRCPRCAKGGRAQTSPDGPCPLVGLRPASSIPAVGLLTM